MNYKEIDLWAGCTIEQVVRRLKDYNDKGVLVYCNFNEAILCSDTVTIEDAYIQVTGKTKAEFNKQYEEWCKEYDRKEKEFKETIPSLIEEWIKKGKEVLTEDKWGYWAEIVPIRLGDLYHGMELGYCLDIIKILNAGEPLEVAKKKIEDQNHSGMSFGLVRSMVREFCDRGEEFASYIN